MLQQYVGHLLQGDSYWSKEYFVEVKANTKEEALGLLLEGYPKSVVHEWEIYGGCVEGNEVGIDELHVGGWEA